MFQIVPYHMSDVSWKCLEHPIIFFSCKSVNRNVMPSKNRKKKPHIQRAKRKIPNWCSFSSLYHVQPILKVYWKSIYPFSRNVADRQTDKHTNQQSRLRNFRRSADVIIWIWCITRSQWPHRSVSNITGRPRKPCKLSNTFIPFGEWPSNISA